MSDQEKAKPHRPWARHYQDEWERRAMDGRLPKLFRLVAVAYGTHRENGHANFAAGDLAHILGASSSTGLWKPMDRSNVRAYIQKAIDCGLLAPGSCTECLVVPREHVAKDSKYQYRMDAPCKVCDQRAEKAHRREAEKLGIDLDEVLREMDAA